LLRRERSYHIATERFDPAGVHAARNHQSIGFQSIGFAHSVESTALEISCWRVTVSFMPHRFVPWRASCRLESIVKSRTRPMLHQTTNLGVRSSNLFGRANNPELPKSASGTRSKRVRGRAGDANTRNGRFVPIPDSWNAAKLFARDHLRKNRCITPKAGLESVGYLSTGKPPPKIDEAVFVEYRLNSGR